MISITLSLQAFRTVTANNFFLFQSMVKMYVGTRIRSFSSKMLNNNINFSNRLHCLDCVKYDIFAVVSTRVRLLSVDNIPAAFIQYR